MDLKKRVPREKWVKISLNTNLKMWSQLHTYFVLEIGHDLKS